MIIIVKTMIYNHYPGLAIIILVVVIIIAMTIISTDFCHGFEEVEGDRASRKRGNTLPRRCPPRGLENRLSKHGLEDRPGKRRFGRSFVRPRRAPAAAAPRGPRPGGRSW